jgi:DNA-binding response OmpR family regulator
MLVEDHETARSIIARTFESGEYTVIEVARGNEVMGRLLESPEAIDLIILDVDLPGKSGLKCREEIRKSYPKLPILLITGSPDVVWDDVEDKYTTMLRKPFKMPEIIGLVNTLISESA